MNAQLPTNHVDLQNLSFQVAFEAYARLTHAQVQLIHTNLAGFYSAFDASARKVLTEQADHSYVRPRGLRMVCVNGELTVC